MAVIASLHLGVPMTIGFSNEPCAYVQARCTGRIDDNRNPKTIAALTNTVSEHLKVPTNRVVVELVDIRVGNIGVGGNVMIPPSE